MSKTQIGFLIFFSAIILGTILFLDQYKQLYKILPIQQAEPHPIGVAPPDDVFNDWFDYRSQKANFHVLLPILPQNAKEKVTDPKTKEVRKYDMYIAEKGDGTIFMITLITLPKIPDKASGHEYLKTLIDEMVAGNENNKLISSNNTVFKTFPAIDFNIENQELAIKGIVFIKKDLMGILTRISKVANKNSNEFAFFSNSFNFNAPQEDN